MLTLGDYNTLRIVKSVDFISDFILTVEKKEKYSFHSVM